MNALPEARRAIHGRTWASAWRAADFDPIERPWRRRESAADIALAIVLGIAGALALVHWWAT